MAEDVISENASSSSQHRCIIDVSELKEMIQRLLSSVKCKSLPCSFPTRKSKGLAVFSEVRWGIVHTIGGDQFVSGHKSAGDN